MDPRIYEIKRPKVYGLFDGPTLIYVGVTTRSLMRRRAEHVQEAKKWDCPVHRYLQPMIEEDRTEDLEVIELDYDSEREAIEALKPGLLNESAGREEPPSYTGPDWKSREVDLLEELSGPKVIEATGYDKNRVYDALHRLDRTDD